MKNTKVLKVSIPLDIQIGIMMLDDCKYVSGSPKEGFVIDTASILKEEGPETREIIEMLLDEHPVFEGWRNSNTLIAEKRDGFSDYPPMRLHQARKLTDKQEEKREKIRREVTKELEK